MSEENQNPEQTKKIDVTPKLGGDVELGGNQQKPVETPKPNEKKPETRDEKDWQKLAEGLDDLAKREREFQTQVRTLEEQKSQLDGLDVSEVKEALESKDPAKALRALGFDPEQAVKTVKERLEDPVAVLTEQLQKISSKQEEIEKQVTENLNKDQQKKIDDAVQDQIKYLDSMVQENPKKYPLVGLYNASPTAFQVLVKAAQQEEQLTHEQALDMLEEVLREKTDAILGSPYAKERVAELQKKSKQKSDSQDDSNSNDRVEPLTNKTTAPVARKTIEEVEAEMPEEVRINPDKRWRWLKKHRFGL